MYEEIEGWFGGIAVVTSRVVFTKHRHGAVVTNSCCPLLNTDLMYQ